MSNTKNIAVTNMDEVNIRIVPIDKLTHSQKDSITQLGQECFGHVDDVSINEHFFAKGFAWLFAYHENKIVGLLALHRRKRVFDKSKFLLGGIGGVCVSNCARKHGIGSKLIIKALEVLSKNGCDVACLNVDMEAPMYSFYEKLGFKMMDRKISFNDIHGKRIFDDGTMFIPLNSLDIYNLIMNSHTTFHYGNGYW